MKGRIYPFDGIGYWSNFKKIIIILKTFSLTKILVVLLFSFTLLYFYFGEIIIYNIFKQDIVFEEMLPVNQTGVVFTVSGEKW